MKAIRINRMTLENFKGQKSLAIDFGGKNTEISGANATGKTTIFDAFTWCLFGKDSTGKENFELKTKDNGTVIPKIEHAVKLELNIDGKNQEFERRLVEEWSKERGSAEVKMKGNTTHYLVNGVEVKASDFSKYVTDVCDEQVFKLITNPHYFPTLDWRMQRSMLTDIAGEVSVLDVVDMNDERQRMVADELSNKDMELFTAEINSRKKKVKEELDQIPTKVQAIESVTPQEPDYSALDKRKAEVEAEIAGIDAKIADASAESRKGYEAVRTFSAKLNEASMHKQQVEMDLRKAETEAKSNLAVADSNARMASMELEAAKRMITTCEDNVRTIESQKQAKAEEWQRINAERYTAAGDGQFICPVYKTVCTDPQALSANEGRKAEAEKSFWSDREARLAKVVTQGKALAESLAKAKDAFAKACSEANAKETALNAAKAKRDSLAALVEPVDVTKSKEWMEANEAEKQAAKYLEEAKAAAGQSTNNEVPRMQSNAASLRAELDQIKQALGIKSVVASNKSAIAGLITREKELAQQLSDIEALEFAKETIEHAQMDELEKRVNGLFRMCKFRMFEQQINGGEKPSCTLLVNGVKYGYGCNRAAEINAGLDIINAMCAYHGVTAPIFIDNAEAVNELIPTASQTIALKVTNDRVLTINN